VSERASGQFTVEDPRWERLSLCSGEATSTPETSTPELGHPQHWTCRLMYRNCSLSTEEYVLNIHLSRQTTITCKLTKTTDAG